jgi:hypothetical protein
MINQPRDVVGVRSNRRVSRLLLRHDAVSPDDDTLANCVSARIVTTSDRTAQHLSVDVRGAPRSLMLQLQEIACGWLSMDSRFVVTSLSPQNAETGEGNSCALAPA